MDEKCDCDLIHEGEVPHERKYIAEESKRLLRMNQNIQSPSTIAEKVEEFNTRIETAVHYKIPYPRPINVIPGATGRNPSVVTPVYLHSYQQNSEASRGRARRVKAPKYDE